MADGGRNRRFRIAARAGYAVNGVIHVLLGILAIGIAVGAGSQNAADQSGVLQGLAESAFGLIIIWVCTIALGALGLWHLVTLGLVKAQGRWRTWGRRLVEAGKGLAYLALALSALIVALGSRSNSSATIRSISERLLESATGAVLLAAIGAAITGGGVGFVVIGLRRGFRKLIDVPPGRRGRVLLRLGRTGYLAKGIALALVGGLILTAALTRDARQAVGLDGALRVVAALPHGAIFLILIGVGLIQYGAFLIVRARVALLASAASGPQASPGAKRPAS